jgi:hypothetical protein
MRRLLQSIITVIISTYSCFSCHDLDLTKKLTESLRRGGGGSVGGAEMVMRVMEMMTK